MLYFSKFKILSVLIFTLIISYFTLSNIFEFDDSYFKRNINLGLDLQGGSYLLLEIDNKPVVTQSLQNKVTELRVSRGEEVIGYKIGCISKDTQKKMDLSHPAKGTLWKHELNQSGVELNKKDYFRYKFNRKSIIIFGI